MSDRNPFVGGAPEARDRQQRERDMREGRKALRKDVEAMKQAEPVRGWAIKSKYAHNHGKIVGVSLEHPEDAIGPERASKYTVVPVEIVEVRE